VLKKLLAALGTLALVLGIVALVAGPASAHNHSVDASCQAGVSINLNSYDTSKGNANHVTVTLDTKIVDDESFGSGVNKTFAWPAPLATHHYTVAVTAWDDKTGSNNWTFTTSGEKDNCQLIVTPAQATSTNAVCTDTNTVGNGGYTIPGNSTGVSGYEILVGGNTWQSVSAGFHPLGAGATVNIRADAATGYTFTGTYTWTFTITSPDKSKCIVPDQPTPTYTTCTTPGNSSPASYTIPADSSHYHFTLTGSNAKLTAGSHSVTPVIVINITLVLDNGSIVPDKTPTTWSFTFKSAGDCFGQTTPAAPTPQYTVCSATPGQASDNGFTITATAGVTYQVKNAQGGWDDLTAGFHPYLDGKTAGAVEIQAIASGPYTITPGAVTDWKFTFSAAKDCLVTVVPKTDSTPVTCDAAHPGQESPGTYTLYAVTGVLYKVQVDSGSFTSKTAGTYDEASGHTVTVMATGDTANGYRIDGDPKTFPTFTFSTAGDCRVSVPAGDPKFVDGVCDANAPGTAIQGTYTVFLADHVHYDATVNGGKSTTLTVGVDNKANPGDVVVITPVADTGYVISPVIAAELLTHTFANPGDCLVKTPFVKPAPTDQSCIPAGGPGGVQLSALAETPLANASVSSSKLSTASLVDAKLTAVASAPAALPAAPAPGDTLTLAFITIPSLVDSPHAIYFINDVIAAPGKHILDPGTYKVSAMPETGYFFDGYDGPWEETLLSAEPCGDLITHPLVDPSATQVQMGCFTGGSYTLSNDLSDPAALTWTVNGSVVGEGKYVVNSPSTVVIHVSANGPSYGLEAGATTDWTFHFVQPTTCDLKTLALTGSTPVGWIALGYAMLVSGLALLAVRFARRRGEQA
jgi:hypothetical protein